MSPVISGSLERQRSGNPEVVVSFAERLIKRYGVLLTTPNHPKSNNQTDSVGTFQTRFDKPGTAGLTPEGGRHRVLRKDKVEIGDSGSRPNATNGAAFAWRKALFQFGGIHDVIP